MAERHVVTALIDKRAELAGCIEHTQTQLRQLVIDLDHLDATIRQFKPDIDLEDIRPKPMPPRHSAFRGQVVRIVLDTLKQSPEPMTSHDLALHVMAERGLNTADRGLVKTVQKRVGSCLRWHRAKGVLRSREGHGGFLLWEIAR